MRIWFGPAAGALLFVGIVVLGFMTPDYSQVQQTVSELGEIGAPGRIAFAALLCAVAACLIVFATAVARVMRASRSSRAPAFLIVAMAISAAGVGLFAYPSPLHNVFGLSELVGYQAPLAAALVVSGKPNARRVVVFSAAMYVAVLVVLAANLTTLHREGAIWARVQPVYGLVQRALFAAWFVWSAGYAVLLDRDMRGTALTHAG